jgi:1,2-diacylglycerol 3-beta-glucosyltransferase
MAFRRNGLMEGVDITLAVAAAPAATAGLYLAVLSVPSRRRVPPTVSTPYVAVLVPAHNEAADIAATVTSLLATDYPPERRRVVVVADNCTDETAGCARSAGAEVIVRTDPSRRGKGFALEFGFAHVLEDPRVDLVMVVDADTLVSDNVITACASRVSAGASVVQVDYQVRESDRSWRTRLLHIAFTAFHDVRSAGRERFGLSCGLRGNGMAFSRTALAQVPHRAFSIVEDLEYGIALGQAGIRVEYAHEAWVKGLMPADGKSSESQRARWEGGRTLIRKRYGAELVRSAIQTRSKLLADLAADVYVPPLAQLASLLSTFGVLSIVGSWSARRLGSRWVASPVVAGVGTAGLVLHVAEGWRRSGTGFAGIADLARAPMYIAWKLGRKVTQRPAKQVPTEWVRTARHEPEEGAA